MCEGALQQRCDPPNEGQDEDVHDDFRDRSKAESHEPEACRLRIFQQPAGLTGNCSIQARAGSTLRVGSGYCEAGSSSGFRWNGDGLWILGN